MAAGNTVFRPMKLASQTTMSAGSGRAVADAVLGRTPEIDFDGLTAQRYGQ